MKVEHYYKPDSKTLREEPQVFTRWVDPTIKQLQQENQQLKEQQKEFINFLESMWEETQDIWYIKILSKYKEIIGENNE